MGNSGESMSDKYIKYGPGCEIDPDVVKNTLRYCADWDDSGPAIEIARKIITALQQREERLQKAKDVLMSAILKNSKTRDPWLRPNLNNEIEKAYDILEGTDG